ncbi:armadillo-type protein [Mycena pura]|uniref:Vacuolar protein 8 n=1 Tax=Mycena pura TaxID=153505 RepID=A0AAD6V696_9AGAR|nr:armadillo-type protein [Mycena pura]
MTWSGILSPSPCLQLVSLLSNQDIQICRYAVLTLANLSQWPKGARSILDAKADKYALDLLNSADANTRAYTCLMLGNLARHKVTWAAILSINPCSQLVSLLTDQDMQVRQFAAFALANLSRWLKCAELVVNNGKAPEHALTLLNSSDDETRAEACRILGNLAAHESTWPVILTINSCWQLVYLLNRWPQGAQLVVNAKAPKHALVLLKSLDARTRAYACYMLGNLAIHEVTSAAVLGTNPCLPLMSQLRNGVIRYYSNQDTQVCRCAALALANISRWPKGAESVVDVKAPEQALALLKSPDTSTRAYTCYMLANLAGHEETWAAILGIDPCLQLVSLLRNQDIQVYQYATLMLANLSQWLEGAQLVLDAKALDLCACCASALANLSQRLEGAEFVVDAKAPKHAMALLNSDDDKTRAEACRILGNLARHKATSGAVLAVNPCLQLVSQLDKNRGVIHFKSDQPIQVCRYAALALANLSLWIQGAESVVNTKSLEYSLALLNCTDAKAQAYACIMLGNLSDHEATWPAVLAINPCLQLVSLLTRQGAGLIHSYSDKNVEVCQCAAFALANISRWGKGAESVVEARALDYTQDLLNSPDSPTREYIRDMLRHLLFHATTIESVMDLRRFFVPPRHMWS